MEHYSPCSFSALIMMMLRQQYHCKLLHAPATNSRISIWSDSCEMPLLYVEDAVHRHRQRSFHGKYFMYLTAFGFGWNVCA